MNNVIVNIPERQGVGVDIRKVTVEESQDYDRLKNKPSINGVTIQGVMSLEDLGISDLATLEYEEVMEI